MLSWWLQNRGHLIYILCSQQYKFSASKSRTISLPMRITDTMNLQVNRQEANCTTMYLTNLGQVEKFLRTKDLRLLPWYPERAKDWLFQHDVQQNGGTTDFSCLSVMTQKIKQEYWSVCFQESQFHQRHWWFSYDKIIDSGGAWKQCSCTLFLQGSD